MEVRDALATGDPATFVSRLPVQIDGSCNGLQHYAALGRDLDGGFSVNLLPSDRPQVRYGAPAPNINDMHFQKDDSCPGLQCCTDLGQHLDETCSHHMESGQHACCSMAPLPCDRSMLMVLGRYCVRLVLPSTDSCHISSVIINSGSSLQPCAAHGLELGQGRVDLSPCIGTPEFYMPAYHSVCNASQ